MLRIVRIVVRTLLSAFHSRRELALENLALRQQLAAFQSKGKHSRIHPADRAF